MSHSGFYAKGQGSHATLRASIEPSMQESEVQNNRQYRQDSTDKFCTIY